MSRKRRVPVRIQLWHEGTVIDVRCWLDDFKYANDLIPVSYDGIFQKYLRAGTNFTLRAHTGGGDDPWKFKRGKPDDA